MAGDVDSDDNFVEVVFVRKLFYIHHKEKHNVMIKSSFATFCESFGTPDEQENYGRKLKMLSHCKHSV